MTQIVGTVCHPDKLWRTSVSVDHRSTEFKQKWRNFWALHTDNLKSNVIKSYPDLYCDYSFIIDLTPTRILFGVKSIGKV